MTNEYIVDFISESAIDGYVTLEQVLMLANKKIRDIDLEILRVENLKKQKAHLKYFIDKCEKSCDSNEIQEEVRIKVELIFTPGFSQFSHVTVNLLTEAIGQTYVDKLILFKIIEISNGFCFKGINFFK